MDQLINVKVNHKVYGTGTVTEINGEVLTILFPESGDKKFIYPDSFEQFLQLSDSTLMKMVEADLNHKKEEIEAKKVELKQKYEEEKLAREIERKATKKPSNRKTRKKAV